MNMDFGANKIPTEVIKEGVLRGTCFREIHSGVNRKWYRKSWKEFNASNDLLFLKHYSSNYHDVSAINMALNTGHH